MARLSYSAITSLDGYVADPDGRFDWAAPDPEVHAYVNDLERPVGTYLYGRRMYQVMQVWQTIEDPEPEMRDYAAIWRAADKVVFSRTLEDVATPRTRLEHDFEPEAVRALKQRATRAISIGGPELAAHALHAGLVDDVHLLVNPVIVGGGNPSLHEGVRLALELVAQRSFANGVVHLHYRAAPA